MRNIKLFLSQHQDGLIPSLHFRYHHSFSLQQRHYRKKMAPQGALLLLLMCIKAGRYDRIITSWCFVKIDFTGILQLTFFYVQKAVLIHHEKRMYFSKHDTHQLSFPIFFFLKHNCLLVVHSQQPKYHDVTYTHWPLY